jgi:hypothetical protein
MPEKLISSIEKSATSDFIMSEDLQGVFDPDSALDEACPVIELMGHKLKYRFMSISSKKDEIRYVIELVEKFDLETFANRDWTDIKIGSEKLIKEADIIRLKISPKLLKLRFRRHTYTQE